MEALRHRLGLPDRSLVEALVRPPLAAPRRPGRRRGGAVGARGAGRPRCSGRSTDLADRPFAAPEADRLAELGLGPRQVGAAVRAGLLLRLADNVVLLRGRAERAVRVLAGLPQPFTLSEARQALDTSRRVAVPLLELLDRTGATRRGPDDRRWVNSPS